MENTGTQRKKLIVEMLRQQFNMSPQTGSAVLDLKELRKHALLKDFDALKKALDGLRAELKPDFEYYLEQFLPRQDGSRYVGTKDGIKIIVDDRSKLDNYLESPHSTELRFDPIKSRLYVKGIEIKIRKFKDQYHALRVIFEDPADTAQEWFFSEIAERIDAHKPGGDKTYYNAVYQIRLKLTAVGMPEFFITTRQSARINPLYLS